MRAVAAAGHAIGDHTWDHPSLIYRLNAELRRQIERTRAAVFDASRR